MPGGNHHDVHGQTQQDHYVVPDPAKITIVITVEYKKFERNVL